MSINTIKWRSIDSVDALSSDTDQVSHDTREVVSTDNDQVSVDAGISTLFLGYFF